MLWFHQLIFFGFTGDRHLIAKTTIQHFIGVIMYTDQSIILEDSFMHIRWSSAFRILSNKQAQSISSQNSAYNITIAEIFSYTPLQFLRLKGF